MAKPWKRAVRRLRRRERRVSPGVVGAAGRVGFGADVRRVDLVGDDRALARGHAGVCAAHADTLRASSQPSLPFTPLPPLSGLHRYALRVLQHLFLFVARQRQWLGNRHQPCHRAHAPLCVCQPFSFSHVLCVDVADCGIYVTVGTDVVVNVDGECVCCWLVV